MLKQVRLFQWLCDRRTCLAFIEFWNTTTATVDYWFQFRHSLTRSNKHWSDSFAEWNDFWNIVAMTVKGSNLERSGWISMFTINRATSNYTGKHSMCSSKQVSYFSNLGYCVLIKSSLRQLRSKLIFTWNYDQLILKLYAIDNGKPLLFEDNTEYIDSCQKLFSGKSFFHYRRIERQKVSSYNVVHAYYFVNSGWARILHVHLHCIGNFLITKLIECNCPAEILI